MPTLDFARIKEIRMVDVCGRYKIALKFRGDYANAQCPLPTHKDGDKGKSFSICISGNYWRCFSESCNANNGGKRGGDCINFVAAMEKCRERDAAQKLADWFGLSTSKPAIVNQLSTKEKTPQRMAEGSVSRIETPGKRYIENNISDSGVKYMATIELWYDKESARGDQESDADYRKRFLNALKTQMVQSYRAGKAAAKV